MILNKLPWGGGKIKDATALPPDVRKGEIFYNNEGRQVGDNPFAYKTVTIQLSPESGLSLGSTGYAIFGGSIERKELHANMLTYGTVHCNGVKTQFIGNKKPYILGISVRGVYYRFSSITEYNYIQLHTNTIGSLQSVDILFRFYSNYNTAEFYIGAAHYGGTNVSDDEFIIVHYLEKED